MNTVINKVEITTKTPKAGDYYSSQTGECYILVQNAEFYSAHDIGTGRRWNGAHTKPEDAVKGLKFLGQNLKVTIENY